MKTEIIKFNDELKKLCNDFNSTTLCDKNMSYYPRQMINQIKKMDEIIPNRDVAFSEIKNKILFIDNCEKIVKTTKNSKRKKNKSTK